MTEKLHADNIARELKGLIKAKQMFAHATAILLTGEPAPRHLSIPDWIAVRDIPNWLLNR